MVSEEELNKVADRLRPYVSSLTSVASRNDYSSEESFINLPFYEGHVAQIVSVQKLLSDRPTRQVLILGIGGSSLGAKAVYSALRKKLTCEAVFIETIDPELPKLRFPLEEILVVVISKSGKTLETKVNLSRLFSRYPILEKNTVYISSVLHEGMFLPIPEKVGGRYSVFSAVGLFPLMMLGVDIFALLEGAMLARKDCLDPDLRSNPAVLSASLAYTHYEMGKTIDVSFFFHSQLENLGKWWCQLTAESLGKDGKGVTPLNSIATQDLHSMLQLYLDGPKDKYTEFVYSETEFSREIAKMLEGVEVSYHKRDLPFSDVILDSLSEKELGYYMQYKMMETLYLAQLLGVNPFGQPAVEEYKSYR